VKAVRALEERLKAWRSFRDVAHATRSLAAAQVLRWNAQVAHTRRQLAWSQAFHERVQRWEDRHRRRPPATCAVLALGTDLGLCGRLNRLVADAALQVVEEQQVVLFAACGARLLDLLPDDVPRLEEPAPSSMAAAVELAERVEAEVGDAGLRTRLCIVSATGVSRGGSPQVETSWDVGSDLAGLAEARAALARPLAQFAPADVAHTRARSLLAHARILHAACEGARAEASVRLARMTRAHESAERRIAEQERVLRKARQEGITQEMLEVLSQRHIAAMAP